MRIAIPKGVVWIEPEYSLASILSYQGAWCPAHVPFPLGTLHDYFSTQREKAGHRESSTQSADTEADEEREPTKGKRKALSDNEEMIHRGVSRKRPKRETIAAGEATKKTRAPGTNSRRVTRASTAQSLRELPVRETRSIARAAVKAAATAEVMAAPSGPLVIKIIPPSKRAGEAAMDTEATGASSEGLSPLQAAVKRSPLRGYRTPPSTQIIDACFGSSPLTEPPSSPAYSTPSEVPNSSPAPRRLWQRGHRRAPSAAESDCTELSVACSTATLVPSALESDEDSTRPGTPHETDVKDGDVLNKVKERLAVHRTPVRSSARIQERRRDSSSISSLFSLPGSPPAAKRVKRRRSRST
ncbi:hypothetical protein C8Q79DRAFT_775780 [Trametes meyenii]|nr:hypothetical protein C8Q79DRAFT_775780 [Trametes meyenii]